MELHQRILLYVGVFYILPWLLCHFLLWDISRRDSTFYDDPEWNIPKAIAIFSAILIFNWYVLGLVITDWKTLYGRRKRAKHILKDLRKKSSDNEELRDRLDDIIKNI